MATSVQDFFNNSTFASQQRKLLIDALTWLLGQVPSDDTPQVGIDAVAYAAYNLAMFKPGGSTSTTTSPDAQWLLAMRAYDQALFNTPVISQGDTILATQVFGP